MAALNDVLVFRLFSCVALEMPKCLFYFGGKRAKPGIWQPCWTKPELHEHSAFVRIRDLSAPQLGRHLRGTRSHRPTHPSHAHPDFRLARLPGWGAPFLQVREPPENGLV